MCLPSSKVECTRIDVASVAAARVLDCQRQTWFCILSLLEVGQFPLLSDIFLLKNYTDLETGGAAQKTSMTTQ